MGVLLGVLQSAITEETGDSLDVSRVENVHSKSVMRAVPAQLARDIFLFMYYFINITAINNNTDTQSRNLNQYKPLL